MLIGLTFLVAWVSAQRRCRAETLPVGETGGANGVSRFAGNRLHAARSVKEAGRKRLRSAPGAAPQVPRRVGTAPRKSDARASGAIITLIATERVTIR